MKELNEVRAPFSSQMKSGSERVIPERWTEDQIDSMVGAGPVGNRKFNIKVQRMNDNTYSVLVKLYAESHIFNGDLKNATDMINTWTDRYYGTIGLAANLPKKYPVQKRPVGESQYKWPGVAKKRNRPQATKRSLMKEMTVDIDVDIILDGQKYRLEKGDKIRIIKE